MENSGEGHWKRNLLVGAVCALAVGAAVVVLRAIGFTSAGKAGGSSAAAVANGRRQSAGDTGILAGAGAAVVRGASYMAGKLLYYFK